MKGNGKYREVWSKAAAMGADRAVKITLASAKQAVTTVQGLKRGAARLGLTCTLRGNAVYVHSNGNRGNGHGK